MKTFRNQWKTAYSNEVIKSDSKNIARWYIKIDKMGFAQFDPFEFSQFDQWDQGIVYSDDIHIGICTNTKDINGCIDRPSSNQSKAYIFSHKGHITSHQTNYRNKQYAESYTTYR